VRIEANQIKKILIIRPDAIGDCVLITPAISLVREKFPNSHIAVLCSPYTKGVFINNPDINEIIEDTKKIRLYRFIQRKKFDLSVHFYNEFHYALLAKLAKIKYRLGDISKPLLIPFYNIRGNCRWNDLTLHETERNILLLSPLEISPRLFTGKPEINPDFLIGVNNLPQNPVSLKIKPNYELRSKFEQEYQLKPDDFVVGIHIGTGKGNKAWLPDRYAKVIDYLIENKKSKIILTGSKKDLSSSQKIIQLCKNKLINLVNKTNLEELIAITSRYNLYIGVDTGPLHIAAALKIPTVAIFPTKFVKPTEWGPWATTNVIIRKSTNCSQKCLPKACPFEDCLKAISVEDVIAGIKTLMENRGNKTIPESKADWLKKSINVFTNRQEIIRELSVAGYHAVEIGMAASPIKLMKQMIKEDINIIHWVGVHCPTALKIARFLATPYLPIPPMLLHEKEQKDFSVKILINNYIRSSQ